MKILKFFLLTIFAGIIFVSCEPTTQPTSQEIANTAWKLVKVQNSEPNETLVYPTEEYAYVIEFYGNNNVAFPRHCNISTGKYLADTNGNISFSDFYPSTKMYCETLSYWEDMVCQNLLYHSQTYEISADKMTIICGGTTLIFQKVVLLKDNILSNTEWKIADHKFLGQDKNVENYSLTLHSDSENIENNWGTFVRFTSEGTFVSFDRQSCGNSCFTTVYGRYSLQGSATLILLVDSVNVNCTGVGGTNETQIRNGEQIKFDILNYSAVAFQLQKEGTVSNSSILGKWCSGDRTIVFAENMLVFDYFPQYLSTDTYFTYSLSSDSITFTFHQQGNFISEKFKYFLNGDELTIYVFSNPFSTANELRTDVVFARCEEHANILGKWNLVEVSLGWRGIQHWNKGWITYEFKTNPNIVTVLVSESVATVNQPLIAPIIESGEYAYFIDNNRIVFGNMIVGYGIWYTEGGKLVLDSGMDADGNGYFFEK